MKKLIALVSPILVVLTIAQTPMAYATKTLFMGAIQFPKTLIAMPDLRIYYGGNIIKYEKHLGNNSISFSFPDDKRRTEFYMLVTETIKFNAIENTIEYIKIPKNQAYKLYTLNLLKTENNEQPLEQSKSKKGSTTHKWDIRETKLKDGRVPDDAIIVCYTPQYVQSVEGGSTIQLPKIIIKDNVLELAGSEDKFMDSSIALLLSSLDTDAIHSNVQQEVKLDYQHKRITIVT